MLVLSKLTNINHANGGSYDPPFFYIPPCSPQGALWRVAPHGGALAGLPRTAFSAAAVHSALGRAIFSLFFAYAPGIRQKHPQKFRRLHCRILYCGGKFKKFVKINE